ncbi:MAG TPA: NAD-dependent epimerase/dehydratase family protein [Candidatus Doudnabacteria bacterium]|nr:NAD-dependent epimerase/dehydratase family protein [Candidatus Doudnabacteria bacterium]
MAKQVILFGGGGFIGSYFAAELLASGDASEVLLADIHFQEEQWPRLLRQFRESGRVATVTFDVRRWEDFSYLTMKPELIVNLAAVHREPGHMEQEYYETNLPGAQNICRWATEVGCNQIIFTSSIAVYGAEEGSVAVLKTESTEPKPNTPYGISKLKAEQIHSAWQAEDNYRQLLIVRPGVIFGAGENGNVTRMLRALKRGYFVFTGNEHTAKAGGYVKELSAAMLYMWRKQQERAHPLTLFNFTMSPAPTVSQYVTAINSFLGKANRTINLPYGLLLGLAVVWAGAWRLIGIKSGINPERIKKLRRSNNIAAAALQAANYQYRFNLHSAMQDWQLERPEDWR